MYRVSRRQCVKFYPQVQWPMTQQSSAFLNPVNIDEPATPSLPVDDIADLRKRLDHRLWSALSDKDWIRWESVVQLYHQHDLPMDEVSYTLLAHGYLMSHHHPSSVALMILEKMKRDSIHPTVVALNENLINSFFQLSDLGIRSSLNGWQNFVRLAWMSAARLRNKRAKRVKQKLDELPTKEVLEMSDTDITALIEEEHQMASLISATPVGQLDR
jgi:hypothetical protein